MDVIIHHWVGITVDKKAGPDGFGYTVADNMTLFYAYYSVIESTNTVWLQWGFYILIGLFEWFGIINNMEKMVKLCVSLGPLSGNNPLQPMHDR